MLHSDVIHNSFNVVRVPANGRVEVGSTPPAVIDGSAPFAFSVWVRVLGPIAPLPPAGAVDLGRSGLIVGPSDCGWCLVAAGDEIWVVDPRDTARMRFTVSGSLADQNWHFLTLRWMKRDDDTFRLIVSVDAVVSEMAFNRLPATQGTGTSLWIGGGSAALDVLCFTLWNRPEDLEVVPHQMPEHTQGLACCFCFSDVPARDMSDHGVALSFHGGARPVGISRALELTGDGFAVVDRSVSEKLKAPSGTGCTLHAWIQPQVGGFASDVEDDFDLPGMTVFRMRHTDGSTVVLRLDENADGSYRPMISGESGAGLAFPATLVAGRWYHLTAVLRRDQWHLLVDGEPVGDSMRSPTISAVNEICIGGSERFGANESNFRGAICSVGIWGRGLSDKEVQSLPNALEFFGEGCLAWYGLGDEGFLRDSLFSAPLTIVGGVRVREILGPALPHVHAHARFARDSAERASGTFHDLAGADALLAKLEAASSEAPDWVALSGGHKLDRSRIRASLRALRPNDSDIAIEERAAVLDRVFVATASGTLSDALTGVMASEDLFHDGRALRTYAISDKCRDLIIAIVADVVAIILTVVGFGLAMSALKSTVATLIGQGLGAVRRTLTALELGDHMGNAAVIFVRLVPALFGNTAGMPSLRVLITQSLRELRWWDVVFALANIGLIVTSIIFTGGGAVALLLATAVVALGALARDVGLYISEGC